MVAMIWSFHGEGSFWEDLIFVIPVLPTAVFLSHHYAKSYAKSTEVEAALTGVSNAIFSAPLGVLVLSAALGLYDAIKNFSFQWQELKFIFLPPAAIFVLAAIPAAILGVMCGLHIHLWVEDLQKQNESFRQAPSN